MGAASASPRPRPEAPPPRPRRASRPPVLGAGGERVSEAEARGVNLGPARTRGRRAAFLQPGASPVMPTEADRCRGRPDRGGRGPGAAAQLPPAPQTLTRHFQRLHEVLTELEAASRRLRRLEALRRDFELQKVCYLPLNAFLLKPLQRLRHYRLLLRRLCASDRQDPDRGDQDRADRRGECAHNTQPPRAPRSPPAAPRAGGRWSASEPHTWGATWPGGSF